MKRILKTGGLFLMTMLFGIACQEDHELGALLEKSQISFDVIQDYDTDPGGNTVILRNNTEGTVSMWDYSTGRSTRRQDTVRFPFQGEYTIKFSAVTAGGIVDMDPIVIQVTEDNLNYVNDPLWTALSGGPGNEKTWLLDIDENGISKYWSSPMYFSGDVWRWGNTCSVDDDRCWIWEPDWDGNTWIADPNNYGTMTFSLMGGPFVTVDHQNSPGLGYEEGTFFLDINAKTLTLTDAAPLCNNWANGGNIEDWSLGYIISLTEDAMQIGYKDKAKSEFIIFNYISQEYSDNWVPEEEDEGDPNFDHGDQGEIIAVSSSKTWKLDLEVPYNWTGLEGNFLNDWNSRADIIASGWAPYGDGDVANIDNVRIIFTADGDVTIVQDDGSSASGTYAIDEATNTITFTDITPNIPIASWVSASTTDLNQWKIVIVERHPVNNAPTGLWLGKRDPVKDEYMVFHFVTE